jgi:hypothetical protein
MGWVMQILPYGVQGSVDRPQKAERRPQRPAAEVRRKASEEALNSLPCFWR